MEKSIGVVVEEGYKGERRKGVVEKMLGVVVKGDGEEKMGEMGL